MFYCEACADERNYPKHDRRFQSSGPCEFCREVRACYDVPSVALGLIDSGQITTEQAEQRLAEVVRHVDAVFPER